MRESQIRFIGQLGYPVPGADNKWYEALQFQPRAIGCLVAAGAAFQSPLLFLALSAVLWWSTIVPAANPFDAIANRLVVRPRGFPPLPPAPPPRRFAQGLAGTAALVIAVASIGHMMAVAWILQGLFGVAVLAVVFRDDCAGAALFNALKRPKKVGLRQRARV